MTAIRRAGHAMITTVALLFAIFLAVEGVALGSGQVMAASERGPAGASTALETSEPPVVRESDLLQSGHEDCEGRRTGRAPATAPAPNGKPVYVCGCNAHRAGSASQTTIPARSRDQVPVSRSGELPVALQIFRC